MLGLCMFTLGVSVRMCEWVSVGACGRAGGWVGGVWGVNLMSHHLLSPQLNVSNTHTHNQLVHVRFFLTGLCGDFEGRFLMRVGPRIVTIVQPEPHATADKFLPLAIVKRFRGRVSCNVNDVFPTSAVSKR